MMSLTVLIAGAAAWLLLSPYTARAAERVALVIGNGAYKYTTPLDNPPNDASDISAALRNLGFEVVEGTDLDRRAMESKIRTFGDQVADASIALFYYAGHGMQIAGENYLIPVDARLQRAGDISLDTIDLQVVLDQMQSRQRVNLIFLDACRDNPLARKFASNGDRSRSLAVGQGLARVQSAVGTMIAFATEPDNVALDGGGRNSPFAAALLRHIRDPGQDIAVVMREVRKDVLAATEGRQLPWDNTSLTDAVVLAPVGGTTAKAVGAQAPDDLTHEASLAYDRKDFVTALALYRDAAVRGGAAAQNKLGELYRDGKTGPPDALEAARWLLMGAEGGDASAQANLGEMYQRGLGVRQDYAVALQWYRKAADQGNVVGEEGLGILYLKGLHVPRDYGAARDWFQKAADQGYPWAQADLGNLYHHGLGVDRDFNLARGWYQKAADQGNAAGQDGLGVLYQEGLGVARDYGAARSWYQKAANQSYAWAQADLGGLYRRGWGVEQDFVAARSWYQKAADQGNPAGQDGLGLLYENGLGIARDYGAAHDLFQRAAAQGYGWAQANLGEMYRHGRGVARDYDAARRLFQLAADQENPEGQNGLGVLYENGYGVDKNYKTASNWYQLAADQNYPWAEMNLGYLYAYGRGVTQNCLIAIDWFRKALAGNYSSVNALMRDHPACSFLP